jgi:hypothetical protein
MLQLLHHLLLLLHLLVGTKAHLLHVGSSCTQTAVVAVLHQLVTME